MTYPVKTLSQLRPILQGFRKDAGMTQAAMAAQLGVTQQTYAQLEANPAAVSVERLFRVLRVLGVELALTTPAVKTPKTAAAKKTAVKRDTAAAKTRENW
jgi:HTH-type transcriptional regulator / antitoxin HipB